MSTEGETGASYVSQSRLTFSAKAWLTLTTMKEGGNRAYQALASAHQGKRYDIRKGAYGIAEQPIALFHAKTWSKIRKGVLKFLDEHPVKATPASPSE